VRPVSEKESKGKDVIRGIGVYFDLRNPPRWRQPWAWHYRRTLERVRLAEDLGASTVWLTEHHFFEDGYLPQPLTMAAAVAARTERVRIGTAVYLPLLRHPMQVAEEAAIVDILSGGRFDLGVGIGYRPREYADFGAPMTQRYVDLEVHVGAIRAAWEATATPPPLQDPMPLWAGFFGARGAQLAGRLKMGLLAADPALVAPYESGLAEGGHRRTDAHLRALSPIFVADDPEAAWEIAKPHVDYQWNSYRWYEAEGSDRRPAPFDVERWRPGSGPNPRFVLTDIDGAVAHMKAMAERVPLEELYCWATLPGLSPELADRHLELLLTRVRPQVVGGETIAPGVSGTAVRQH
jgi:alkanesulfonate monooxygenase SsuD/methylene tetrahydromethanopterin reductase-like flavin-dependent oxidoreductase (luciferase family)